MLINQFPINNAFSLSDCSCTQKWGKEFVPDIVYIFEGSRYKQFLKGFDIVSTQNITISLNLFLSVFFQSSSRNICLHLPLHLLTVSTCLSFLPKSRISQDNWIHRYKLLKMTGGLPFAQSVKFLSEKSNTILYLRYKTFLLSQENTCPKASLFIGWN